MTGEVVGLLPFDSTFPNLALMKLSTHRKAKGDTVTLFDRLGTRPDLVYVSVVFSWNLQQSLGLSKMYPDIHFIYGGSAYSYDCLPNEVEHLKPDYDLYPTDFSMGFTSRGCIRKCGFCLVPSKEGYIHNHSPLDEFLESSHSKVMLLDNNLLASPNWRETLRKLAELGLKVDYNQGLDVRLMDEEKAGLLANTRYYGYPKWSRQTLRFAFDNIDDRKTVERGIQLLLDAGVKGRHLFCYILVGYDSAIKEDVERLEIIKSYGAVPFIMKYNNKSSPELNRLAKYVNHIPYYQVVDFSDFDTKLIGKAKL